MAPVVRSGMRLAVSSFRGFVLAATLLGCAQATSGDATDGTDVDDGPDAGVGDPLDAGALTVEITGGPAASTEATEATFTFTTSGPVESITCQVDDLLAEVCTSPHTVTGLGLGAHTFTVDVVGGGDSATASYPWEIVQGCVPMVLEAETLGSDWPVASGAVLSGGQGLSQTTAGESFSFDFYGTSLTMFVETGPNLHVLTSIVDDDVFVMHDANNPSFQFQQPFLIQSGLVEGSHNVVITCMSPNCAPDFFEVGCD